MYRGKRRRRRRIGMEEMSAVGLYMRLKGWDKVKEKEEEMVGEELVDARYRDWETDRKSTRLNSSHRSLSRMPSSA